MAIETATARLEPPPTRVDLILRCRCEVRWTLPDLSLEVALEHAHDASARGAAIGENHAALGMLLEVSGRTDDAYQRYGVALGCEDRFDRAFCWERRGVYEAAHGAPRDALRSLRTALAEDNRATGARQTRYRAALAQLEAALSTQGLLDELGEPLTDDVIAIDRLIRAERWDDAIAALHALDMNKRVDAIGFASRGAERAYAAGRIPTAVALQELVVTAYTAWASWSTSGAEGLARTADVDRERTRLRQWQAQLASFRR